jgi:hypothetical protein
MKTIRLKFLMLMSVLGTIFPITSQAADIFTYNGLRFIISSEKDRTVMITSKSVYSDNENYVKGHISIPPKVIYNSKSYSVTGIYYHAFDNCRGLTSVDIPSSVIVISNGWRGAS